MRGRCKEGRRKAAQQARNVKRELNNLMRDRMTPIVQEKVMKLKTQFQRLVKQYKKPVRFSAEHYFRSNALSCTAVACILIPAECSAFS